MRNKLIKRQYFLLIIGFFLFLLFLLGSWSLYDLFYPLARPIHLPEAAEVTAITVTKLDGSDQDITDRKSINNIMLTLLSAKPTRKWTVNDCPTVPLYGGLDIHTEKGTETIFYYRERGVWYAEQPYQGIYEMTDLE